MVEPVFYRREDPGARVEADNSIHHTAEWDIPWAVELDGFVFRSKSEYRRYKELKILAEKGYITHLEVGKRFKLYVNGKYITTYECDFFYVRKKRNGEMETVVEEIKGNVIEKEFVIKWHLMKALYPNFKYKVTYKNKYDLDL